jgi:hypothetical protein
MPGRTPLPSGARRKASQRQKHDAVSAPAPAPSGPTWQPGAKVRWREYSGTFLRDADDGQVEILIGPRTYRVARAELRSA